MQESEDLRKLCKLAQTELLCNLSLSYCPSPYDRPVPWPCFRDHCILSSEVIQSCVLTQKGIIFCAYIGVEKIKELFILMKVQFASNVFATMTF